MIEGGKRRDNEAAKGHGIPYRSDGFVARQFEEVARPTRDVTDAASNAPWHVCSIMHFARRTTRDKAGASTAADPTALPHF